MLSGDEFYGDEVTSPLVRPVAPSILARYTSNHGGYEAQVRRTSTGFYGVTIFDLDASTTLPYARHFKTEEAAKAYAQSCMANEMTKEDSNDLPF